jgi:hypothetical protein
VSLLSHLSLLAFCLNAAPWFPQKNEQPKTSDFP